MKIDSDTVQSCINQCRPELERLMSLNVDKLDISRLTDKEKAEIIDAVYAVVCCVMSGGE